MFRIGEFSRLSQVSIRMLRYYDETGLLKPAKVDPLSGYRLYSVEQIKVLQKIVLLRDMDFSVAEIAAVQKNWGNELFEEQLKNKKAELQNTIIALSKKMIQIDLALELNREKNMEIHYNIMLKKIEECTILSLRRVIPRHMEEGLLWCELFQYAKKEHIDIFSGDNIAIYHDEEQKDCHVDVEVGICVKKAGKDKNGFHFRQLEGVECMACMMVQGPYENIESAFEAFAQWLENHEHYKMNGKTRQICHKGPCDEEDSKNYLTELQIPVKKW